MTDIEWEMIGNIIRTADNGCGGCVRNLTKKFYYSFPDMNKEAFKKGLKIGNDYWLDEVDHWFEQTDS